MSDVNFMGVNTPLGRFLTTTGFGSVQNLVGIRQTPVLGTAPIPAATAAAVPGTGIIATFTDQAGSIVAGNGANTQEILNAPQNWRGYVLGLEVQYQAGAIIAELNDYLAECYIRVTAGGIDTDVPLSVCYRVTSQDFNAGDASGYSIRNPYFYSAPLFWPGDGSEVVRVMAKNDIGGAVTNFDMVLTLHVALGRSQDNSQVQAGFGGPTACANGDQFMAATQNAATLRRSFTG